MAAVWRVESVRTRVLTATCILGLCLALGLSAASAQPYPPSGGIRLSNGLKIVSISPAKKEAPAGGAISIASGPAKYPQPPVSGFSPLIAITTSDKKSSDDFDFEHTLVSSYTGQPLNSPAEENFVIGLLDTGSVVDLAAGASAEILGLQGRYLTANTFPIGGVSGQMDTMITQPIGIFAAGLGAVGANGQLDLSQVVGHTNVAALAAPAIACDTGEEVSAVVGTPMLAFYTTVIHVDQPRKVVVRGKTHIGPDIQIMDFYAPSTQEYRRQIPIELGGLSPLSTASYYAFPDLSGDWEDILGVWEPIVPTLLSMMSMSLPTGGAFFTELQIVHGEPGPLNPLQTMRVLLDTGAQSSIMSSNVAARLNLPLEPDFTVQICGIGGVNEAPGYFVDYVRINALGGALEYGHVPFVVVDMESPEGGPLDGVLGMNFFWNRNVVLEPTVGGAGFLHVSDPVPYAYIDLNLDDVVDVADFAIFAASWHTTPADPAWNPLCDFYTDEVIDARDLEAFTESWLNSLAK
jgi:hypothetical protein